MAETITLPARMDLSAAQSFSEELSKQNFSGDVTLDATELTHLGAICVQAILLAAREAAAAGGSFQITNVDEKVEDQLACMGLSVETLAGGAL